MKTTSQSSNRRQPAGFALRLHAPLLALVSGLCLPGVAAESLNWPQWRGPAATGLAASGNPPSTWSENENIRWKVQIPGNGAGTPIIWGNQIFVQTAIATGKKIEPPVVEKKEAGLGAPQVFGQAQRPPGGAAPEGQGRRRPGGGGGGFGGRAEKPTEVQQFVLLSLDRVTGKTQWQRNLREEVPHEGHHPDHGYASHSPITDGQHLYSWLGSRGLSCYDLKGELKWKKDFGQQRTAAGFGEGNSPALHGNTLVINWDHEGADFIAAFHKETGAELWRNVREEKTTWTSPLVVEFGGKAQVIVSASQRIRSYDLATGRQIWECGGMTANVIPTPVSDFDMVYAISGFRGNSLLAIKLGKTGDLTDSDAIAWKHTKATPYVPSPLLYGDKLYFLSGNNAVLSCFNAKSGEAIFAEQRLEGPSGYYASPIGVGGRIYLPGRNGTTVVLKQSDKFEVIATNKLDEGFDASPAVVGNELFLRGHKYLYCVAEK